MWRLDVELVARRVAPIRYAVMVVWDGRWSAGPIGTHLQVSGLRKLARSYSKLYDRGGSSTRDAMTHEDSGEPPTV
jgi:hypothetical protein